MKPSFFSKTRSFFGRHKIMTIFIAIVVIVVAYYAYHRATVANAEPQYVLAPARIGTLTQTVTGTGQVSASNQTDIQSQVSGTIRSINVSVGQTVKAGQLVAKIDSTNAAIALQNAKLALAKLVEPPKATDISNAENTLSKSYSDAFNSASSIYLDLPAVMSGMKTLYYGQSGFLGTQQSTSL